LMLKQVAMPAPNFALDFGGFWPIRAPFWSMRKLRSNYHGVASNPAPEEQDIFLAAIYVSYILK
jgi:hypothetical protein